ncbi:hypothetical protein TNCV_3802211 [Trichonephila clavipes]|nr:hypothetical protein TNCV_3802211 [Trichonephila clavipes]
MDENCRQYAGTNPLCTRLHGDPEKCRLEMRVYFSYPLSTRNFGGKKRRVFSNSPMMHCARDSFIQDGCCFGLLALDNRRNNNPHKHLERPKRIGYNCPEFGSLQVPISNKNYIPFRSFPDIVSSWPFGRELLSISIKTSVSEGTERCDVSGDRLSRFIDFRSVKDVSGEIELFLVQLRYL